MWVVSGDLLGRTAPNYVDFLYDQSPESLPSQLEYDHSYHLVRDVVAIFNTAMRSAAVAEGKRAGERHTP